MNDKKMPLMVDCPTCRSKVEWIDSNEFRPFCSQRCKNTDFCDWANEEHRIGGNSMYDGLLSGNLNSEENFDG